MKIIIIGAGELGQLVAAKLSALSHDVVVVDTRAENFGESGEALDTRLLVGAGTSVETLKKAGAANADLILALSGDEAANILSCTMAKVLGTKKSICRVFSPETFSETDGITPSAFHIDHVLAPVEESVRQIHSILQNRILRHEITFENPDALLDVVSVPLNSQLSGVAIRDLPCGELLQKIRLAAVVRHRKLIVPHGDTVLLPGDNLYVAGRAQDVKEFVKWLSNDGSSPLRRVVVAGASLIGERLVSRLVEDGLEVRVIESDYLKTERLLSKLPLNVKAIHGAPTDMEIQEETDVAGCDVFVAVSERDENNILACLLATRAGAKKVIALTGTAEYMDIMPSLENAGCWFNTTQIAANAVFRLMSQGTIRVDPELRAINARLVELELGEKSPLVGRSLRECKVPEYLLLALVIRGVQVIAPTGATVLEKGDQVVVITGAEDAQRIRKFV